MPTVQEPDGEPNEKPTTKGRRGGNGKHIPNKEGRSLVSLLAMQGSDQDSIASALKITKPTLRKHYREELDGAVPKMLANAMGVIAKALRAKDQKIRLQAAQYIMGCRGGWKLGQALEIDDRRIGAEDAKESARIIRETSDPNFASQTYSDMVTGLGQPKH